jgi:hypothetical protein
VFYDELRLASESILLRECAKGDGETDCVLPISYVVLRSGGSGDYRWNSGEEIMPGLLQKNARCPKCSTPLVAIIRTWNSQGVTAEYCHDKGIDGTPRPRRKRRCKVYYSEPLTKAQRDEVMDGLLAAGTGGKK